ncbi:penicillin-binding protein [Candidatus Peregrinibacteria bacterium]|nr:penicillin-binding protein [Candidatus Peregrinibacteria bacterium]
MFKKRNIFKYQKHYHLEKIRKFIKNPRTPKWKKIIYSIVLAAGAMILFGIISIIGVVAVISISLPSSDDFRKLSLIESTRIFDRNGELLYAIHGEENREIVKLEKISKNLINATIAIEDDEFYKHPGFDTIAILRCAAYHFLPSKSKCGGSTITQQFVKLNFLTSERTLLRKLKELILAVKIENTLSKNEILELYLNKIPYGNNAYGAQMAAKTYFNKNASDLTIAESVILAAIPKAPSYYSPYGQNSASHFIKELEPEEIQKRNIQNEKDLKNDEYFIGLIGSEVPLMEGRSVYIAGRSDLVVNRMLEVNLIDKNTRDQALKEIHNVQFMPPKSNMKAPHFVLYIKELLEKTYGKDLVEQGGLQVYTTLDLKLQTIADTIIKNNAIQNLETYDVNNASLVAIDPKTGQILAMVGAVDYSNTEISGNVNVALRPRQPGSSFKPFIYARSFLNGYGPATVLHDVSTDFGDYRPKNFDGKFFGAINIRTALGKSRNIPAIKAYFLAGEQNSVIEMIKSFGMMSVDEKRYYGPSLALGSSEVTLLDMVAGYAVFANNGIKKEVTPFLKIENAQKQILAEWDEKDQGKEVLNPEVAFLVNDILSDTSVNIGQRLNLEGHAAAVKTGTSTKPDSNYPGNLWTIGYTPSLVAGVWAGNTDGSKTAYNADGYNVAAPIWNAFMREALKEKPNENFSMPPGIQKIQVSKISGLLPGVSTPQEYVISEYFTSFGVPKELDNTFQIVSIDTTTGKLATEWCPKEKIIEKSFEVHHSILPDKYPNWEAGVQAWVAYKQEQGDFEGMAPTENCPIHDETTALRAPNIKIISPLPQSSIAPGKLKVEIDVNAPLGVDHVEFYLNDQLQYTTKNEPYEGLLRISKLNPEGSELDIRVTVFDKLFYSKTSQITVRLENRLENNIDNTNNENALPKINTEADTEDLPALLP